MTDRLDDVVARTHADLDEIERLRLEMKGPCEKCSFWGYETSPSHFGEVCRCPTVTGLFLDPVSGKVHPKKTVYCKVARRRGGDCGEEGRCFVPRPVPPPPEPRQRFSLWRLLTRGHNT